MTERICKYCKYHSTYESYCRKLETTKGGNSSCDEFEKSKFAETRNTNGLIKWYK